MHSGVSLIHIHTHTHSWTCREQAHTHIHSYLSLTHTHTHTHTQSDVSLFYRTSTPKRAAVNKPIEYNEQFKLDIHASLLPRTCITIEAYYGEQERVSLTHTGSRSRLRERVSLTHTHTTTASKSECRSRIHTPTSFSLSNTHKLILSHVHPPLSRVPSNAHPDARTLNENAQAHLKSTRSPNSVAKGDSE